MALNPDGVRPPEELWETETEYLMEIVDAYLPPRDATALDFRLRAWPAREAVDRTQELVGAGRRHQPANGGVGDRVRKV